MKEFIKKLKAELEYQKKMLLNDHGDWAPVTRVMLEDSIIELQTKIVNCEAVAKVG